MRRLPILTIGLVVSAWMLPAADISGIWLGSVQSGGRRPQLQDVAFQFAQKGTTLTGKLYLDQGSTPIRKGTIEGEQITFEVLAREQAGNEIVQTVLRFTGSFKDGEIELTRERQEVKTAGNASAAFTRPGSQTFRLHRLP